MINKLLEHFRTNINNDLLYIAIISFGVAAVLIVFGKMISLTLRKLLKPIVKRSKAKIDDQMFELMKSTFFKIIILIGLSVGLGIFKSGLSLQSGNPPQKLITYYPYFEDIVIGADYALFLLIVVIILVVSFRTVTILFNWYSGKIDAGENKNLSGSLFPLLQKLSKMLLTALAFVIVLAKFHIDISGFIVSLGVGSLAIALAAQETISNMISGFIIMTDRPFRIGDRIKVNPDLVGDVIEIGVRSTKVLDFDNNIIIVPNNDIVKSRIVNLTYPSALSRVVVEVMVSYNCDIDKVKKILISVAENNPLVAKSPAPDTFLTKFDDSGVSYRLTAFTENYQNNAKLGSELREAILIEFRKEKIEIPFPQMDIRLQKNNES
ncbi:MAG: mechanosensitive ion channel family protein [Ignavibacteriaceae bacterium]|jgi:small-conductance mechanosensitive channel|nr:mechanosensitive ion channel family protein [Ignavibacteriaceae bacterium]